MSTGITFVREPHTRKMFISIQDLVNYFHILRVKSLEVAANQTEDTKRVSANILADIYKDLEVEFTEFEHRNA